jgi:outer membrane protein TolC
MITLEHFLILSLFLNLFLNFLSPVMVRSTHAEEVTFIAPTPTPITTPVLTPAPSPTLTATPTPTVTPLVMSTPTAVVSLEEAYQSALEKTEILPLGASQINQINAKIDQTQSRYLPSVSLIGNHLRQKTISPQTSARINVAQSLYEGGKDANTVEVYKSQKEVQKQTLFVTEYATYTAIAKLYYAILSNQTEAENLSKIIEFAKDRVNVIQKRTRIGRSRNVDLLSAQSQLAVLESQYKSVEGQLALAWDQFMLMTDLPRELKLVYNTGTIESPKDLNSYLSLMEQRPDIQLLKSQIDSAQKSVSLAKSGHYPSAAFLGNYYLYRDGPQRTNKWDLGVSLTLPIYAGGIVNAQVGEASEKVTQQELLLKQTRRQAELNVRNQYQIIVSALQQITSLESALETSEKNYIEQEKNYLYGQSNNLDVITALNSFQDIKRTLDRTRFQALEAWAELKAATAQITTTLPKGTL